MVQYFQVRKIVHETVTTLCRTGQNCISLSLQAMCINFCGVTLVQCVCSCKSQKLYYYRRGTPGWHSTGSHSHLSTWTGSSLLLSGSSGDHLQCRLPPVQLCVQKQKVITKLVYIGIYTFSVHTLHHVVSHCMRFADIRTGVHTTLEQYSHKTNSKTNSCCCM